VGIQLEKEQQDAVDAIVKWYSEKSKQTLKMAGLAGTGKTTIVKYVEDKLGITRVGYCAFTGKAAMVLTQKGTPATTMHKLMYNVEEDPVTHDPVFSKKLEFEEAYDLIVVDEASMVSKELQADLESFKVPILYVGDHGQLPPVGDGFSNLMQTPDIKLEKIHRQAEGNPIIFMSKMIRLGARLPNKIYGPGVIKLSLKDVTPLMLTSTDQILCGKNATRKKLNSRVRQLIGFKKDGELEEGDKVICLRNNWKKGFINGMGGTAHNIGEFDREAATVPKEEWWRFPEGTMSMLFKNEMGDVFHSVPYDQAVFHGMAPDFKNRWIEAFDFGYAITVHKSQGSQYYVPMIIEEYLGDSAFHKRWLYTAVTRAVQGLILVSAGK